MIGDIVGAAGLNALETSLPALIKERQIDFVTVNGENAAGGFGLTEADFNRIIAAGADVVTSGNHIWEKRDFWQVLENDNRVLRPANYPKDAPGAGFVCVEKSNINYLVINLQGRDLMSAIDCPFRCFDSIINNNRPASGAFLVIVDFHAETTREKEALAYYACSRASLIAGTHTHVQTADERILPDTGDRAAGCAYITDLGMTGINDSVIGMDPKICLERARKQIMFKMEAAGNLPEEIAANKTGQLKGVIAEINADTGRAVSIERI